MDNMDNISNDSIKKLSIKAGVIYISSLAYHPIKYHIIKSIKTICKKLKIFNKKRLLKEYILYVLPYNTSYIYNIKKCDIDKQSQIEKNNDKKYNILLRYKTLYDNIDDNCLFLTKTVFKKIFIDILNEYDTKFIQYPQDSLNLLQLNVEYNVVELLKFANDIKNHNRETLMPKDIYDAEKIIYNYNYYNRNNDLYYILPYDIDFDIYIEKLLQQIHPNFDIEKETVNNISLYLKIVCKYIIDECIKISNFENIKTLTHSLIHNSCYAIFDYNLSKFVIKKSIKAIDKYKSYKHQQTNISNKKRMSKGKKADLIFEPSEVRKLISIFWNNNISDTAPIFMATILESICAEFLDLSGNFAIDHSDPYLIPKINVGHLYMVIHGIYKDEGFESLTKTINYVFPGIKFIFPAINPYQQYINDKYTKN